jgi:hypothetical protein
LARVNRRDFLIHAAAGTATAAFGASVPIEPASLGSSHDLLPAFDVASSQTPGIGESSPIDFRYSPLSYQTLFCFPDDPLKSLVGERGDLRYGFDPKRQGGFVDWADMPITIEFTLQGMNTDRVVSQELESPVVPIVHTVVERAAVRMELVTFATNRAGEGRVDNVLMTVTPRRDQMVHAGPVVSITSRQRFTRKAVSSPALSLCNAGGDPDETDVCGQPIQVLVDSPEKPLFMVVGLISGDAFGAQQGVAGESTLFAFHPRPASVEKPMRCIFRFPQQGQSYEQLAAGLNDPASLLEETRAYWSAWRPTQFPVEWNLHGRHDEFLSTSARNILQARELKEGKLTFQVGPTVYRGLWVVDGNFLLEAARYLGYDKDAEEGLRSTWSRQQADGMIVAGGGNQHWKDSAIAIFTLVRQAELSQDWSLFQELKPNVLRSVAFLAQVRERGKRAADSPNGRYGLLVEGFADGGLAFGSEITNTLWTLAGLKALNDVTRKKNLRGYESAETLYNQLRAGLTDCVKSEMRQSPEGFSYLPMLLKADKLWSLPDEWERPRPQAAQWALSHCIFPGLLFAPDDPIVRGHVDLMLSCTQEDIPAGTGWNPHEAVWTYNALFVAEVYLWLGMRDLARRTFAGFLNHASPLYCWREEQPLREGLNGTYVGDMPHNWASAECIRFLRHTLALEDGDNLRLLAGVTPEDLAFGKPIGLAQSPTRFGRVSLDLEPLDGGRGWRLIYRRGQGPAPARVEVPERLGKFKSSRVEGSTMKSSPGSSVLLIAPEQDNWTFFWEA